MCKVAQDAASQEAPEAGDAVRTKFSEQNRSDTRWAHTWRTHESSIAAEEILPRRPTPLQCRKERAHHGESVAHSSQEQLALSCPRAPSGLVDALEAQAGECSLGFTFLPDFITMEMNDADEEQADHGADGDTNHGTSRQAVVRRACSPPEVTNVFESREYFLYVLRVYKAVIKP